MCFTPGLYVTWPFLQRPGLPLHTRPGRACMNPGYCWLHMHDDVIKWKHFPRYLPFVQGIHRSPVNSPHKDQWRGALMCSLICAWINGWVNNREAGDLRRHCTYNDVIVMLNVTKFILKMRYFSVRLYPELVHQDPFCDYGGMMKKRSILFKSFMNIFE